MAPTKEKILVLDDEPHILDLIQMRLESQGYEVITAATGDEALAKARSTVVDMAVHGPYARRRARTAFR